jgi:hypothetical protein
VSVFQPDVVYTSHGLKLWFLIPNGVGNYAFSPDWNMLAGASYDKDEISGSNGICGLERNEA